MQLVKDYLSSSYMTIMLLAALSIIIIVNRKNQIKGIGCVIIVMILTFTISMLDHLELWCDLTGRPVWILYVKSFLSYSIYPFILLLEIFMTVNVRYKFLLALPEIINFNLLLINAFGKSIVFGYHKDHSFFRGPGGYYPICLMIFYIWIMAYNALKMIRKNEKQRGGIILSISLLSIITLYAEYIDLIRNFTDDAIALGLFIYYWYMTAIYHNEIQEKLYLSRLELEQSKNEMLMAQIQPHFINNSLMSLRSLCRDNTEMYESLTNFSLYLRSHFDALGNTKEISFEEEMENIEAYLSLEQLNFGDRLDIDYDIEADDFYIPALSVQPLVENAVRHGIGSYDKGGKLRIATRRTDDRIIIEVIDDGSGKSSITPKQKKRKGVGVENVRARLRSISNGELDIIKGEHGTTARITISDPGSQTGGKP